MKCIAISDTHGKHNQLVLPEADCIIHAGDVSNTGKDYQIKEFIDWFERLPYQHKIFIAGNHDFWFETASKKDIDAMIPKSIHYLNDSGVTIEGVQFWGSPISPWFYNWAFNRHRGDAIKKHWDLIPLQTNVLITHGPAFGILDYTLGGQAVGCDDLLIAINNIKPKLHICGHIHEAYGCVTKEATTFINASVLDANYFMRNEPIEFDL